MTRTPLAAVVALGLATTAAAGPLQVFDTWGSFRAESSAIVSPHTTDSVKIERAAGPEFGAAEVWVLERTTVTERDTGRTSETRWADSRTCPPLIPTLAGLADLEPVSIQPPGAPWPRGRMDAATARELRQHGGGGGDRIIYDAGTYEIEAQGHWPVARMSGSVVMRSGAGTPAAAWVTDAFRALEPCWRDTRP
jgi:hypothetical protein